MYINIFRGLFGILIFVLITYLISKHKKSINWKLILFGILIQFVLAILILKIPIIYELFNNVSKFFRLIYQFSLEGSEFIFGKNLVRNDEFGFIFAFRILPSIVFFSAISSLLYYLRILPFFVNLFAILLRKLLKLSGAESLSVAANVFLGHTETPLLIKPYLATMSKSELHTLMTGGFATITGAVLAALVGILGGNDPQKIEYFATHFLVASIISAPAAIVFSKILYPETNMEIQNKDANILESENTGIIGSITNGTIDGLKLAVNVAAMLLVFISLISLVNASLNFVGSNSGIAALTNKDFSVQYLFGLVGAPISWLMGIDWSDSIICGQLIGEKTVFNEIYAYSSMGNLINSGELTNQRSILIISYGLCGFANFGSIGIMIGAIGTIVPSRKREVVKLAFSSLIAGSFACFCTGCIAGILYGIA